MSNIIPTKRSLLILFTFVSGILLIPAVAMQFTHEVNWSGADFLVAALLLIVTGIGVDIIFRTVQNKRYRYLLIGVIILMLLLIWVQLAVGIL